MPSGEHLAMIQGVISRMAQNSFVIKGWSITLAAALIGLSSADNDKDFAWIAVGAVAVFILLDAYYLSLEKRYRTLYDTEKGNTGTVTWTMQVDPPGFGDVVRCVGRPAVWAPHGAALVAALAVALCG